MKSSLDTSPLRPGVTMESAAMSGDRRQLSGQRREILKSGQTQRAPCGPKFDLHFLSLELDKDCTSFIRSPSGVNRVTLRKSYRLSWTLGWSITTASGRIKGRCAAAEHLYRPSLTENNSGKKRSDSSTNRTIGTTKTERAHRRRYATHAKTITDIAEHIEYSTTDSGSKQRSDIFTGCLCPKASKETNGQGCIDWPPNLTTYAKVNIL